MRFGLRAIRHRRLAQACWQFRLGDLNARWDLLRPMLFAFRAASRRLNALRAIFVEEVLRKRGPAPNDPFRAELAERFVEEAGGAPAAIA